MSLDAIKEAHLRRLKVENKALKETIADLEYTNDRMGAELEAGYQASIKDVYEVVGGE